MTIPAILAALSVAFPRPGAALPSVERCYVLGAAAPGTTNVVVSGSSFPVHPQGGWVAMAELKPGTNTISVSCVEPGAEAAAETNIVVVVAPKPPLIDKVVDKITQPEYKKLDYAGDTPRPHPSEHPDRVPVVVIDPGHGENDTGALSPHSLPEKDANLRLALAVKAELVKRGWKVVMTREDDSFPRLYDRPRVAHREGADAFVSIHHNAPPIDKDPRKLRYHCVYAWNEIGERLATAVNRRMAAALGESLKNNGVMKGNLAVTRNPEIPSCLIEADFVTTPEGEIDCWSRERRAKVAAAIADGLDDWRRRQPEP